MPSPRRAGGAGADRPRHGTSAACRSTARSAPAWRPGSGCGERCARRWRTPTSAGTARAHPAGLAGEEVPVAVRVVTVARDAELWARRAGWPATRRGAGAPARPRLRPRRRRRPARRWRALARPRSATIRAPRCSTPSRRPWSTIARGRARRGAGRGRRLHRPQVAVAARSLDRRRRVSWPTPPAPPGCPALTRRTLGRAALVHDVGRVGVPNGIWDRPGPLTRRRSGNGCGCTRTSPSGSCSALRAAGAVRRRRRPPPRARRRLRLPPRHRTASSSTSAPGCSPPPTPTTR